MNLGHQSGISKHSKDFRGLYIRVEVEKHYPTVGFSFGVISASSGEPLNYGAVNSARTYSEKDIEPTSILILRSEEFNKIILHELCLHVLPEKFICETSPFGRKNNLEKFIETISKCYLKASAFWNFDQHHFAVRETERKFSVLQNAKVLLHEEFLSDLPDEGRDTMSTSLHCFSI